MRGQEDESVRRTPTRNELSISSSPSNIKEETNDLITWTPEQDACSIVSILMAVEKTLVRYSVGEPRKIRINDDRIKLFSRTGLHLYANNCTCVIYFGTGSCIVSFSFHFPFHGFFFFFFLLNKYFIPRASIFRAFSMRLYRPRLIRR